MKKLADQLWSEAMQIKYHCQRLAWYMRGGIDYVDIMNMSYDERENINKIVEDNMEVTKKSKMPFF